MRPGQNRVFGTPDCAGGTALSNDLSSTALQVRRPSRGKRLRNFVERGSSAIRLTCSATASLRSAKSSFEKTARLRCGSVFGIVCLLRQYGGEGQAASLANWAASVDSSSAVVELAPPASVCATRSK